MRVPTVPAFVVLDAKHLAITKSQLDNGGTQCPELLHALGHLLSEADEWLARGPWTVTTKKRAGPSGNLHDYVSQAPYWWPTPGQEDIYTRRDGERNPEVFEYPDRWGAECLMQSIPILALAWYYTRREEYANHAACILSTWFLDPDTRMTAHLTHAQFIPGQNTGRSIGIIDFAQGYTEVLDAVAILVSSSAPGWSANDTAGLVAWNQTFLDWLMFSEFGKAESSELNNHGDFASLLKAGVAVFLGRHDIAKLEVSSEKERMAAGIDANGTQPMELARTRSWHYSAFRLVAVTRMAAIAGKLQCDLWAADNRILLRAVEFLIPFAVGDAPWPYKELDFQAYAANDIIRAAADAGSSLAQAALPKLPGSPKGDLWLLRPAPQQLDGPGRSRVMCGDMIASSV